MFTAFVVASAVLVVVVLLLLVVVIAVAGVVVVGGGGVAASAEVTFMHGTDANNCVFSLFLICPVGRLGCRNEGGGLFHNRSCYLKASVAKSWLGS